MHWKNTAIMQDSAVQTLSTGKGNQPITLRLPAPLVEVVRVLEVRLVYDKRARRYTCHVVIENGTRSKAALGAHTVSVDLGEMHPAMVGDSDEATIQSCRARRAASQGHAKPRRKGDNWCCKTSTTRAKPVHTAAIGPNHAVGSIPADSVVAADIALWSVKSIPFQRIRMTSQAEPSSASHRVSYAAQPTAYA